MRLNSRLLLAVSFVGGFGSTSLSLVAPVWILSLTGSSALAAVCGFLVYLPSAFGPAFGAVVDRVNRKRLLIATNLCLAIALTSLLAVSDRDDLWILYLVMLCYGVGHVLDDAAESALLPAALQPHELGPLNGMRMSAREGIKLIAPLAGAGLFTAAGGRAVAAVSIVALVVAALLYSRIRPHSAVKAMGRARIRDGIAYLTKHPIIGRLVLVASVAVAMSGLSLAASYTVVTEVLGLDPAFLGVTAAAQGAGSIAGGLIAGRMPERFGTWGSVIFAAGVACKFVPATPIVVAGSVIVGIGLPWTVVAAMTAVQRHTPHHLLGRVSATATTAVFAPVAAAIPLGALLDYRVALGITVAAAAIAPIHNRSLRLAPRHAVEHDTRFMINQ